ncbi:hypothetical protein [Glutamicibacter ardleyensis]|uniref:hypothetical protein n=1 Tax=Glutamicibacter ardleyensis TaxID=225894 RepID=UPI003FD23378
MRVTLRFLVIVPMLHEGSANRQVASLPERTRSSADLFLGEHLADVPLEQDRGLQGNDFSVVKTGFSAALTEAGSKLFNGQYRGPADG